MLKLKINTTKNYSLNFNQKKRKPKDIKFLIFHYTGMKSQRKAINKLLGIGSKVSCHYFIKKDGEVLNLVPDLYTAWHAGVSGWKNYRSLNKSSIGIEINNAGHNFKYNKFTSKQINSLIILCNFLIKKFSIKKSFILGHSDIAPDRKKDPGEKFPWKKLSKNNIGLWHDLSSSYISKNRNVKTSKMEKKLFIKNLFKLGYPKNKKIKVGRYSKIITKAFQRRFRQENISGLIDQECILISQNLVKKFK